MIPSKKKKAHQRVHHYTLSTTRKRNILPSQKYGPTVVIPARSFPIGSGIQFGCLIEVVRKQTGFPGFHLLPRHYERKPISSEAQGYFASSRLLLRQTCNNQTPYKMTVG